MKRTAKVDLSKIDRAKLNSVIEKRSKIILVSPGLVDPNPYNKNVMGKQYFEALKANMANPNIGFTQPILVRPHPENKKRYMIVDGEHRWKAATELGLERVPVMNLDDMPEALAKYLMLEQNAVRGATKPEDQQKILEEIENDPAWKTLMEDFDPYAGTISDEKVDASKYDSGDDDPDSAVGATHPQTLFFTDVQLAIYRRVVGQIRLARGVNAEAALIECIGHFEECTGLGVPNGDDAPEVLDDV